MSLKTWKKEFYSGVRKAAKSEITAVEHSVRKWEGLLDENLIKHEMNLSCLDFEIRDAQGKSLEINNETCALCVRHDMECWNCSLYDTLKNKECYAGKQPFDIWENTGNAKPMVKALKKTLNRLREEELL